MKKLHKTCGKGDTFGECFDLNISEDCVILCRNSGRGWVPFKFLLPHQVYLQDLKDDLKENGDASTIYAVFPVNSYNYIKVAEGS